MKISKKISLIISNKNEAKTIGQVIEKSKKYVDEIIIVDGHSHDGSRKIAETHGVKVLLDNGKGKGAAIKLGVQKAKGDILVFIDADDSHEEKDILKLVKPIIKKKQI